MRLRSRASEKGLGKNEGCQQQQGRTVLFVSHNFNAVRSLCETAIVLENGKMVLMNDVASAINYYEDGISSVRVWKGRDGDNSLQILEANVYSSA